MPTANSRMSGYMSIDIEAADATTKVTTAVAWLERSGFLKRNENNSRVFPASLRVASLEEALVRMDKGTYGICRDCGEPIAQARLEAIPWTRVCIECKQKQNS